MSDHSEIDEIDVKILKTLLKDPRASFADIAKDCGISSNSIRLRFEALKETGVITGAIMQVNPKLFGYNCVAYLYIQTDGNKEAKIYKLLESMPNIIFSRPQIGKHNISSFVVLTNVDELAHTIEYINNHSHAKKVETIIWVDVVRMDHPENLIIEPVNEAHYATKPDANNEKAEKMSSPVAKLDKTNQTMTAGTFDKLDLSIIRILSINARLSFTKIAKKLGVSTNTVIQRYNRLKKEALPYSSITLDLRKLGYIGSAEFRIKVSRQRNISQVFKEICQVPNIIVAMKCLGTCDILAFAPFKNIDDLFKLNHSISAVNGVQELEVIVDKPFPTWPINVFFPILSNLSQKDYI